MPTFKLYGRRGCHLCDVLLEELLPLIRDRATVEVLDIDTCPELGKKYDRLVPVLLLHEQVICQHRLDRPALAEILDDIAPGAA